MVYSTRALRIELISYSITSLPGSSNKFIVAHEDRCTPELDGNDLLKVRINRRTGAPAPRESNMGQPE
jgi:hypothetical protein